MRGQGSQMNASGLQAPPYARPTGPADVRLSSSGLTVQYILRE